MNDAQEGVTPGLVEGRFSGRQAFRQAVRNLLSVADESGWKEMLFVDVDYADWPLGELAPVQSLQRWSRPGRKLTLLAQDFRGLQRDCPRFVTWRQTWDHLFEGRRCARGAGATSALPCAIWTPEWVLHRLEGERFVAYLGRDAARRLQLKEMLLDLIKVSTPAFPATTLGL